MDVTFFEGQSYYSNSHLQGESTSEDDGFLDGSTFKFGHDDVNELNVKNIDRPVIMPSQNQNIKMT